MGYMVELNTLLRPTAPFDFSHIELRKEYTTILERERAFPLRIAMLLIDSNWTFYGYATANSILVKDNKTVITFTMLTLFSPSEQLLYKEKFIEAGKMTGEVK